MLVRRLYVFFLITKDVNYLNVEFFEKLLEKNNIILVVDFVYLVLVY